MMFPTIPTIIKKLFPNRIWEGSSENNAIYLTFDDGPIPEITPWVLSQLQAYNAKATFFCIGQNVEKYPEILKRIASEGHGVGNHTYNHLNGRKTSDAEYIQNTEKARAVIAENLSEKSAKNALFRPPYGRISCSQVKLLREKGYEIIMWSILSMDYDARISAAKCARNVTKNLKPGSVVVFHDSLKAEKNVRKVLPKILEFGSKNGFTFQKLNQSKN